MSIKSYYPVDSKELSKFVLDVRNSIDDLIKVSDDELVVIIDELIKSRVVDYWTSRLREKPLDQLIVLKNLVKSGNVGVVDEISEEQEVYGAREAKKEEGKKRSIGRSSKGRKSKSK